MSIRSGLLDRLLTQGTEYSEYPPPEQGPLPRKQLYEPYHSSEEEFELIRLEGVARCYQVERGQMVTMVGCVWFGATSEFWQPLEKVSAEIVCELMRRDSHAYHYLTAVLPAYKNKPFVMVPPEDPQDDEIRVMPNLTPGPFFPCVPTKLFTRAEAELAGWTQYMAHREWGSDIIGMNLVKVCRVLVFAKSTWELTLSFNRTAVTVYT